eukprot:gene5348-44722_t
MRDLLRRSSPALGARVLADDRSGRGCACGWGYAAHAADAGR